MSKDEMDAALRLIFDGIEGLKKACGGVRKFTIDGRLVGDIGEIIAEREFAIVLDEKGRSEYDARTLDGRNVQIKATFKDSLTFKKVSELYIGLKLSRDGSHEVVFNGPGRYIAERYARRKDLGEKLLSFPVAVLRDLSNAVPDAEKVPSRRA